MKRTEFVHWEEGLFLQPHHLQVAQRQALEASSAERRLFQPFPHGVIESRLSRDELANHLVRFERLQVIMPSGLWIDVPGNADLPALDISEALQAGAGPLRISLGVPLWYSSRANSIDDAPDVDWRVKRLYRVTKSEHADENTGENPQWIRMRRINARLLLPGDDETDLETLPLLQVVPGTGEEVGTPREDPRFVPPCVILGGSVVLTNLLRDIANAVEASRAELQVQMTRGGFDVDVMRGRQFEQMLRLRTLSAYGARLLSEVEVGCSTPYAMYLELRGLLAELAALRPERESATAAEYDHDAPYAVFADVTARIRSLLRGAVAPSFLKIEFRADGDYAVAEIADEHLSRPTEYYLAVRTKEDATTLARLITDKDRFKLLPRSRAGEAIRGVRLVEERHPPLQLPAEANLHYFRLLPAESRLVWEAIVKERTISANLLDTGMSDADIAIYMPVSGDGAGAGVSP